MIIYMDKNKTPEVVCTHGTGTFFAAEVTQQEYNALTDDAKTNIIFYITDTTPNKIILNGVSYGAGGNIIDSFESTSTTDGLSANKGKELYDLVSGIGEILDTINKKVV